jgi:hypothetical protein
MESPLKDRTLPIMQVRTGFLLSRLLPVPPGEAGFARAAMHQMQSAPQTIHERGRGTTLLDGRLCCLTNYFAL